MEYEDRITIATPEGIELEYALAGYGSRFTAELIDLLLRLIVLAAITAGLAALGGGPLTLATFILALFLAMFVYDVVFEVWAAGRTPGKRWNGLRVVMSGGQPVSLGPSAVRNLLRLIDEWLTLSIAGMVSILVTHRNQRLGDLAAGTIVVRERRAKVAQLQPSERQKTADAIDVTAVTATELAAVRDFLARRDSLSREARPRVARALADRLVDKVGGLPPGGYSPELLLETIAAAKDS
jgi:uncharacterized RDD family membrane protein YckC